MPEQTPNLWTVVESQQNLSQNAQPEQTQVEAQPTQTAEQTNVTWTSSWVEQTQEAPAQPAEAQPTQAPTAEDLMKQMQGIVDDSKTLNEVAEKNEQEQIAKENEDALKSIVDEQTKDLPAEPTAEIKTEVASSDQETNQLDEEIKQWLEDIKDKKSAEDMAKKVYLAFQKERSLHQFDNEQNKNTIQILKDKVKQLNEQVTTMDNDPRVTKLDDEFYTLWRLEQSYKADKSNNSKQNLIRYYVAKLATLNPVRNVNQIMDIFNTPEHKSNTMGAPVQTSAPVAEPKKDVPAPRGLPVWKRGIF